MHLALDAQLYGSSGYHKIPVGEQFLGFGAPNSEAASGWSTSSLSGLTGNWGTRSNLVPLYSASTGRPGLEWCWGNILQWIGSTACGGSRTLSKKFGHWGEKVGGEKNRLKLIAGDFLDALQVCHRTQSSACGGSGNIWGAEH
ncbi:hypothetical protein B0H13DRAFT_1852151 [Mycena leptocephala]|nr:hypothetical protein B0H13DRAFT_1852151 [Mycena leptocephala]